MKIFQVIIASFYAAIGISKLVSWRNLALQLSLPVTLVITVGLFEIIFSMIILLSLIIKLPKWFFIFSIVILALTALLALVVHYVRGELLLAFINLILIFLTFINIVL